VRLDSKEVNAKLTNFCKLVRTYIFICIVRDAIVRHCAFASVLNNAVVDKDMSQVGYKNYF